jgi:hydrogenase expression/formation protein HypD
VRNFSVFCNHVTIIPAIRAILDSPDMRIDGFVGPGHVSTVIGCRPYDWIAKNEGKPVVVSGFEPLDILQSIVMLLRPASEGRGRREPVQARGPVGRQSRGAERHRRSVSTCGRTSNGAAWDSFRNRPCVCAIAMPNGMPSSASIPGIRVTDPKAAQCGEVLKGVLKPNQCKLFGRECTPEHPVGALMVSSEGLLRGVS